MNKSLSRHSGFTLIELMIVLVVLGILASLAFPSYSEYVKRGHRSEGQAFLNDASARQERYFAQNNTYITSTADIDKLGLKNGRLSETGKYQLSLSRIDGDGGYTLTAMEQFSDTKCGDLILNALGVKGRSGNDMSVEDCWR
ncbi:type IV pilin protein [Pseudomonas subflava]|uniref:type IV pilin protein n=1 Tax=Pseudomonas subflava TaxID=2952933 RepID=UPI00207AB4A1|nr:type IV pilin protein [Pseudomonas subflava]